MKLSIGVLIDDLVTKELASLIVCLQAVRSIDSCYEDNADLRLMPYGYKIGLIDEALCIKKWLKKHKKELMEGLEYLGNNTAHTIQ